MKARIQALDPSAFVEVASAADLHRRALGQRRFNALLTRLFAALAVSLMAIGIYGTVTWSVVGKTREIGIRKALGADSRHLMRRELTRSLRPVAVGVVVGCVAGASLLRIAEGVVAGLVGGPLSTYFAVAAMVMTIAVAAAWRPARQAARADPMRALHEE